jgi:cardiolipin synthase
MKIRKRQVSFSWRDAALILGWLLYWNTNRRRVKPKFELSGRGDSATMVESFIGVTEGAIDAGNRVEILQNGAYFDRLLEDIAAAKKSIHIETFIWWKGDICDRIAEALARRSREGVEVRLLLDYSGSHRMERQLRKMMIEAGCQVSRFHPPRLTNIGRLNMRTHRKINVFDGRIGYVGGHGIAEEWSGNAQDKEHFRDTFVRMEGPVVNTLQGVFCENWVEETGRVPVGEKYFPKLEPVGDTDAHVAFVSPRGSMSAVQMLYYLAITFAQRELLIQNPYFLPHPDAIDELLQAAKRGVDVRVMLPAASATDMAIVQHASHHHYGDLLKGGVRIFEYQPTLLHQKILIVDQQWSCVGSTNFDDRSFELNDEVTVGFTDPDIARQLRAAFFDDMKFAEEIELDEWRRRSWAHKVVDELAFSVRREL